MASWVIAAVVAVVALLALLAWWLWPGGSADDLAGDADGAQATECIQGDMTLPVAADAASEQAARELVESWAATDPVVRDYCVQPTYVDDVSLAAVYVGITDGPLADANRGTATADTTPVAAIPVGVAGAPDATLESVTFPVADAPGVAQVVASALSGDRDAVIATLARDRDVTSEQAAAAERFAATEAAAGAEFSALGVVEARAVALTAAGEVSEEQSRAAAVFVDHAEEQYSAPAEGVQPVDQEILTAVRNAPPAEAEPAPAPAPEEEAPVAAAPVSTLFVVDTSQYMANTMGQLSEAVRGSAEALAAAGQGSALWNFSSPLNPGVTQGFRSNLDFGASPEEIGRAIGRFGTAGVPQSRSAVVASVNTATARAQETGQPVRVIVVTTGTEADMSDEVFADRFRPNESVDLVVVHVGGGPVDPVLAGAADRSIEVADLGGLPDALRQASGV
ncbi:hypothetical protein CGUA_06500 [Corynebacterium guangdongense]|nr:hypothetical protein CGUA_06500 [Corynebacterium guangdongense]